MTMITTTNRPLVFIDFETTGLSPVEDRIIQIAALKIQDGKKESFVTYVDPERPISEFITDLTGISNETVKGAVNENNSIEMLLLFIPKDAIIVAQNAPFDLSFLHHATLRAKMNSFTFDFYCTRTMSAILFPNISHKLVDIVNLFDIELEQAHNALHDVNATENLFFKLKHIADLHKINFINKLIEHPDRPLSFKPDNAIMIPTPERRHK